MILVACGREGGAGSGSPSLQTLVQPTYRSIFQQVIVPHCLECHKGPKPGGDVDLSTYGKMMDVAPPVVRAGDPDRSVFVTSVESGKMPKDKPRLPVATAAALRAWVKAGARNN